MSQDPPPPSDKPSDRNPFEVLGLQGTEELPDIRKAFLRIAAVSHPDRLRSKSPEERAQALDVFLAAKKAFETLSLPDKRREWSERMPRPAAPGPAAPGPAAVPPPTTPAPAARPVTPPPRPVTPPPRPGSSGPRPATDTAAQQLYRLGMMSLEAKDYAKALGLMSKAAQLSPTPRLQAMELVCRGHQYLSTRFFERARESFEQALQVLPSCREAQVSLELLEEQQSRYQRRR